MLSEIEMSRHEVGQSNYCTSIFIVSIKHFVLYKKYSVSADWSWMHESWSLADSHSYQKNMDVKIFWKTLFFWDGIRIALIWE